VGAVETGVAENEEVEYTNRIRTRRRVQAGGDEYICKISNLLAR